MVKMFNLEEIKNLIKSLEPKIDRVISALRERNKIQRRRNDIMVDILNQLEEISDDEGDSDG